MEFKKYKLGELCRLSSSKRIFESEYVNNGIPFIRGQEISDKSILDENSKFECYISEERYNEIKEKYGGNKEIMTRSDVKSGSIKINDDDLLAIQKWIVSSKATDSESADIDAII